MSVVAAEAPEAAGEEGHAFSEQQLTVKHNKRSPGRMGGARLKADEYDVEEAFKKHHALSVNDSFPPTNFHVIWPRRTEFNYRPNPNNLKERDNGLDEGYRIRSSKDFPHRLKNHTGPLTARRARDDPHIRPSTAGECLGPGKHEPTGSAPRPNTAFNTVRPRKKRSHTRALITVPGPGSYKPTIPDTEIPHTFPRGTHVVKPIDGRRGPGSYKTDKFHALETHLIPKEARFSDNKEKGPRGPGPGAYHSGALVSNMPKHLQCEVYRQPAIEIVSVDKKSRGPGTYNPFFFDASLMAGGHRFSKSSRFDAVGGAGVAGGRAVLRASSSRRSRTKPPSKPDLRQYTVMRREQRLLDKKQRRIEKERKAQTAREHLHTVHMRKMDRIINKEEYMKKQKHEREEKEMREKIQSAWFVSIALAARTTGLTMQLKEIIDTRNQEKKETEAANLINRSVKSWLLNKKTKTEADAVKKIANCLRLNLLRGRMKRRKKKAEVLTTFLSETQVRNSLVLRLETLRQSAILGQRGWRRFAQMKNARKEVFMRQLNLEETKLLKKYKDFETKKLLDKMKKKGADQKMIDLAISKLSLTTPSIPQELKEKLIDHEFIARRYAGTNHRLLKTQFALSTLSHKIKGVIIKQKRLHELVSAAHYEMEMGLAKRKVLKKLMVILRKKKRGKGSRGKGANSTSQTKHSGKSGEAEALDDIYDLDCVDENDDDDDNVSDDELTTPATTKDKLPSYGGGVKHNASGVGGKSTDFQASSSVVGGGGKRRE